MRKLYLLLAAIGFVLPYYFFVSFLIQNGLDLQLLFSQLFANDISTFFGVDLIITAIVFLNVTILRGAEIPDAELVALPRCHLGSRTILCLPLVSVLPRGTDRGVGL